MPQERDPRAYRILVAVGSSEQATILMSVAVPIARARAGMVVPLYVGREAQTPVWLRVPDALRDVVMEPLATAAANVGAAILASVDEQQPDLLLLHWKGRPSRGRYLLGRTLDPVLQYAPCSVGVVLVSETPSDFRDRMANVRRVLVPLAGGPNAAMALDLALSLAPEVEVTALRIAQQSLGETAMAAQWDTLGAALEPFAGSTRIRPRVEMASSVLEGIVQEAARGHDLMLVGASRESMVDRLLFGNLPQQIATRSAVPVIIVRRREPGPMLALRQVRWRLMRLLPQLTFDERVAIYKQVRRSARTDVDFMTMMVLSAAIASLGLLLNSAAVIIGAMLVAPLMSSLLGVSLSVVQGDFWMLRVSLRTALLGVALVLLVSAMVSGIIPNPRTTQEMLARTNPTLIDLGVALLSGAAASYATCRRDVASALAGVAIAVALVPPLATTGLLLATGSVRQAGSALLLFSTNLAAIVAAATVFFIWLGFRPERAEQVRKRTFESGVVGTFALLGAIALLLAAPTVRSVQRATLNRAVERVLVSELSEMEGIALVGWAVDADAHPLRVDVSLNAERTLTGMEAWQVQERLTRDLGRQVTLSLGVIPTTVIGPPGS